MPAATERPAAWSDSRSRCDLGLTSGPDGFGGAGTPTDSHTSVLGTETFGAHAVEVPSPTFVVIDDHPGFRRAARTLGEAAGGVVVGEAESVAAALEITDTIIGADLVLMDLQLGDGSGIGLTRSLVEIAPGARIVLVSSVGEADLPADTHDCGAVGFVSKAALSVEIIADLLHP